MTSNVDKGQDGSRLVQLIAAQQNYLDQILKLWPNFKKLAIPKRTRAAVQNRLRTLDTFWQGCMQRHDEILMLAMPEHRDALDYFVTDAFASITECAEEVRDAFSEALEAFPVPSASSHTNASESSSATAAASTAKPPPTTLPPINLPKFSGELTAWPGFRDLFSARVHSRTDLSNVQKLHYLKHSLEGEAYNVLKSKEVAEANYQSAWELLRKRYENPRAIVYAYFDKVLSLPKVGPRNEADLRRLRDQALDIYQAIADLGRPIQQWEDQYVHFVLTKLDPQMRHEWELTQPDVTTFPTYAQLDEYLSLRLRAFQTATPTCKENVVVKAMPNEHRRRDFRVHQTNTSQLRCFVCQGDHPLFQCQVFSAKPVDKRIELISGQERCLNCFRRGHRAKSCTSKYSCHICKLKHHTLLHSERNRSQASQVVDRSKTIQRPIAEPEASSTLVPAVTEISNNCAKINAMSTVLPTATVVVKGDTGRKVKIRALFDQGSQATFVSQRIAQCLKLKRRGTNVSVTGIGSSEIGEIKHAVSLVVESGNENSDNINIKALVLPNLSSYLPPAVTLSTKWAHLRSLQLADEDIYSREPVNLIIGADYFGAFLRDGLIRGPPDAPIAQLTICGWIISGRVTSSGSVPQNVTVNHAATPDSLQDLLVKFWDLEEVPDLPLPTEAERDCEKHFADTHSRDSEGRYVVRLPFRMPLPIPIGNTEHSARRLFLRQEVRLQNQEGMRAEYVRFMSEYIELRHMRLVPPAEQHQPAVYLPHHPVVKDSSTTTRVRVVFNASFRSDNATTLNDCLHVGPKLQADLVALVLRWRTHRYVYAADLEKMFRQISLHEDDVDFQRVFWRNSPEDELHAYRLTTVTYGTACAPFLANRVLRQLAEDEGDRFPKGAYILLHCVYVDDLMFGAGEMPTLNASRYELTQLLRAGGFHAYKWTANDPSLLSEIPFSDRGSSADKDLGEESHLKVLGICWDHAQDAFLVKTTPSPIVSTKRQFLSLLARLYDPHGWVAPVIITGKILMQSFWLHKIGWDEQLPSPLLEKCREFQTQVPELHKVVIPRWTGQQPGVGTLQLHGFSDASSSAYAAVIYLRLETTNSPPIVTLFYAKTKVAPVKIQSLPRLELCGAHLLSKAIQFVVKSIELPHTSIYCWTDSTVVLHWLSSHASRWKTFIANRVSAIQSGLPSAIWRHIPTAYNPADCGSRGLPPHQLVEHDLWWQGPSFLKLDSASWPPPLHQAPLPDCLEEKKVVNIAHVNVNPLLELVTRVSSWTKLQRVTAYILRFINRIRKRECTYVSVLVSAQEMIDAAKRLCHTTQVVHFSNVITKLTKTPKAKEIRDLNRLSLFRDHEGLIRVGGRLRNASLSEQEKFPILLPNDRLSELIIQHAHRVTLHGGPQVVLRFVRQTYWVLKARVITKRISFKCIVCARQRAVMASQRMGDLPAVRVTPSRPFANVGIDYAGPFLIRSSKGRGIKSHKSYCVIFVCLAVRAIHLECADDYTTESFLAALDRFVSCRGLPNAIYSDNGTNFVGASRELKAQFRRVIREPECQVRCANEGISWHFIPPAAPQFGGLWEAGVKSVKYHLKRTIGSFTPSYEEFSTLLCKIESILNSRPIAPLYDDPETYDALTPGHFLTGSYLKAVPTCSVSDVPDNRLSRWQAVRKCQEAFWKVWSSDYLNTLQQRMKAQIPQPNIVVGDLVLVRHPNLPPTKWELGRVTRTFPGQDALVRVVNVKTSRSEYKRPVTQLCRLPVDSRTGVVPPPL